MIWPLIGALALTVLLLIQSAILMFVARRLVTLGWVLSDITKSSRNGYYLAGAGEAVMSDQQAGTEIEITEEMIRAGKTALLYHSLGASPSDVPEETVIDVFRAMAAASPDCLRRPTPASQQHREKGNG